MLPTTDTRPVVGLTGKGRAAALLVALRDRWDQLTPEQQAECSAILARLRYLLRCPDSGEVAVARL